MIIVLVVMKKRGRLKHLKSSKILSQEFRVDRESKNRNKT